MSSLPARPKLGVTPTNNKFKVPAPTAAPGSRPRRGVTPRSASRIKSQGIGGCTQSGTRPRLTAEQQLEIIQRLEAGNYKKDEGIAQFYEEFAVKENQSKMTCKQNLYSSFASVDPLASSTRIYGSGRAGSVESLISMCSSVVSSVPSSNTTTFEGEAEVTVLEVRDKEINQFLNVGVTSCYYIEAFDTIIKSMEDYSKNLDNLALLKCQTMFAELLPEQKMVKFIESLDRVYKILKKFLSRNASENMELFMPPPPRSIKGSQSRTSMIRCDVEDHSKVVQSFFRLGEMLTKLDSFLQQEPTKFKLDQKLETLKETVSKLEELIKNQELNALEVREMMKKTNSMGQEDACSVIGNNYDESP